jgi:uncharacterized protein (TIGR03905 family)
VPALEYTYKTGDGVCSNSISITIEEGIIKKVNFSGGCNGNLQGVSRLVTGMKPQEVVEKLRGISCATSGSRSSCPDQLARAIEEIIKKESGKK